MNRMTTPPLNRSSMPAVPWFGFARGLLIALLPSLRARARAAAGPLPDWVFAARMRRRVLLALVLALGAGSAWLGAEAGIPDGAPLLLSSVLMAWVGAGFVTALMGAFVLWRGDAHALRAPARGPISRAARTAIIMPICNEDIATVFGGLRATCESLAATGALSLFDIYVLSDTPDPRLRAAEVQAWCELRASLGDGPQPGLAAAPPRGCEETGGGPAFPSDEAPGGRIFYRARRHRVAKKAGNVADFCRRWGADYRYMVVLDADSVMHGDTLVALVRQMEAHPRAGILQTLPQPLGHDTLHARAQQFATRVSGRLFALGMAYWQMGDSHYWGHNAILRMQPFLDHCRIAPLPGNGGLSGHILSHDFVEAALMRRAGYEVWLLPSLGGSWEQTPPNLLDELQRDRRWCQGNLQNARLIAEPGWQPAHRAMFATGLLAYLAAPLWLALLASGVVLATAGAPAGNAAWWLWGLTLVLLFLPRVLGVAALLWLGEHRRHGGPWRLLASSVIEAGVSALQAPVRMLAHSSFVASALIGLKLEWRSPPRDARSVQWSDAFMRIGLLTLPVLLLAAWWLPASGQAGAWPMWSVTLPLALAVPMAVASGHAGLGALARRWGLLTVAEEIQMPRALQRARSTLGFEALQPAAAVPAGAVPQPARPRSWPSGPWGPAAQRVLAWKHSGAWRVPFVAVAAAATIAAVVPRTALSPVIDLDALTGTRAVSATPAQSRKLASAHRRATARAPIANPRPARFIDDAVRERALRAVERSVSQDVAPEPVQG